MWQVCTDFSTFCSQVIVNVNNRYLQETHLRAGLILLVLIVQSLIEGKKDLINPPPSDSKKVKKQSTSDYSDKSSQ